MCLYFIFDSMRVQKRKNFLDNLNFFLYYCCSQLLLLATIRVEYGNSMGPGIFKLIQQMKKECLGTERKIMEEFGLSAAEFNSLMTLHPEEHITGHEFSRKMDLSKSRGSRVIAKLQQRGFIKVKTVPENRRRTEVFLTQRGIKLKEKIDFRISQCETEMFSALDTKQKKIFKEILQVLLDNNRAG